MLSKESLSTILQKPAGAPRLVPVKEALWYGKFGLTRLYHLIADGKIKARKDGRKTLVDLDSIDAYQRSLPPLVGHRTRRRRQRSGK